MISAALIVFAGIVLLIAFNWPPGGGTKGAAWVESTIMTPAGLIYTVRDKPGCEREIQHAKTGEWTPESQVKFSYLPMYEKYHRDDYFRVCQTHRGPRGT